MSLRRRLLTIASAFAAAAGLVLATGSSALAQPIPPEFTFTSVEKCLDGEALPMYLVGTYSADGQRINLRCGTPVGVGLLHIDDDHPVTAEDTLDFLTCVASIFNRGAYRGPGNGPNLEVWDREYYPGTKAVAVFDTSRGNEVVTVYTTTGLLSNDWSGCAAYK